MMLSREWCLRQGRALLSRYAAIPSMSSERGARDSLARSYSVAICFLGLLTRSTASSAATQLDEAILAFGFGALIFILLMIALYFLPAIVALARGHEFKWVILAVNLAAGWTLLGWAVAIIWAVWPREKSLVDPFVGNPTGLARRNSGDSMGAYSYGKSRGYEQERAYDASAQRPLSGTHIEQLERLSSLRESGALTEAEFLEHKTRILGGILNHG